MPPWTAFCSPSRGKPSLRRSVRCPVAARRTERLVRAKKYSKWPFSRRDVAARRVASVSTKSALALGIRRLSREPPGHYGPHKKLSRESNHAGETPGRSSAAGPKTLASIATMVCFRPGRLEEGPRGNGPPQSRRKKHRNQPGGGTSGPSGRVL